MNGIKNYAFIYQVLFYGKNGIDIKNIFRSLSYAVYSNGKLSEYADSDNFSLFISELLEDPHFEICASETKAFIDKLGTEPELKRFCRPFLKGCLKHMETHKVHWATKEQIKKYLTL